PARLVSEDDGSVTLIAEVDHFTIFAVANRLGYRSFLTPLAPRGLTLAAWGGGTIDDVLATQGVVGLWTSVEGRWFGYVAGAPAFANATFRSQFASGLIPAGTPFIVVRSEE